MNAPREFTDAIGFLDDVHDDMKQAKRWLLWKSIPDGDKKPRKVPFYASGAPRSGQMDGADDQSRFATFGEACRALLAGGYAGLGFALGPDGTGNCWQGIDFDGVPDRPELAELVSDLPGYTETSPSGKGSEHAIGYGPRSTPWGATAPG